MDDLNTWSLEWFAPSTLGGFTWTNNLFLYAIALVPLLFAARWGWRYFFNQKLPVAFTRQEAKTSPLTWIRLIPELLLGLVAILILLALARPQRSNEKVEQWTEGIDIMQPVHAD
jgi:Ca-activated chloride channel family protein